MTALRNSKPRRVYPMVEVLETRQLLALTNGLQGSYFNNTTLTGTPLVRVDSTVDFPWGNGSPMSGINTDNFSVRWEGELQASVAGSYQFRTLSDDGVRLWINGTLLIDNWTNHATTTDTSAAVTMAAGDLVSIRMNYYDAGGGATARLQWLTPGQTVFETIPQAQLYPTGFGNGVRGDYFANQTLTGTPVSRTDAWVAFNWGSNAPTAGIPADHFSARWTGEIEVVGAGDYQFQTVSDDGVRLWINNVQLINNWTDHVTTTDTSATVTLSEGQRVPVTMEYYENTGGATAQLLWKRPGQAAFEVIRQKRLFSTPVAIVGGLSAQYYANTNYTSPSDAGAVAGVNIAGDGTGDVFRSGPYSVRFDGKLISPVTGTVRFYLYSRGGSRLWLDDSVIVDNHWDQTWGNEAYADMQLVAGRSYNFRTTFFCSIANSKCALSWSYAGQAKQIVPARVFSQDAFVARLAYPQTGWHPNEPKTFILATTDSIAAPSYQVANGSGQQVLSGTLSSAGQYWKQYQYTGDISSLTTPGVYTLSVGSYAQATITIAADVFTTIRGSGGNIGVADMLSSFWSYQRDPNPNHANTPNYTNLSHYQSVTDGQPYVLADNDITADARGGWFDATSCDKEAMDNASELAQLCFALERTTSATARAALRSEILYGAAFLLKVQNADGSFPVKMDPGDKSNPPVLVVNQSTGAVGGCAAAMAAVSEVLRGSDPSFAAQCLSAARNAWTWIEAHPSEYLRGVFNDIWSGSLGSVICGAVELARATGEQKYSDYVINAMAQGQFGSDGYWMGRNGVTLTGQIASQYIGQMEEIASAFTAIGLARFYSIAPNATVKQQVKDLCLQYIQCIQKTNANPYQVPESLFATWMGFAPAMVRQAACLPHIGVELNLPQAVGLGLKEYEWATGLNPLGTSSIVGFGTRNIVVPFGRPWQWSIGGVLPGPKVTNGEVSTEYSEPWSQWVVGEAVIATPVLDVLAMLNTYYNPDLTPAQLVSAVSRRSHGVAGNFDIPLNLTGTAAVENRVGGPALILVNFSEPVVLGGSFALTLSSGTGQVSVSGSTLSISMSGATDVQMLTIDLNNLADAAGNPGSYRLYLGVLMGDVNGSGSITVADIALVKNKTSMGTDATNFRLDVNCSGSITTADVALVKSRTSIGLPLAIPSSSLMSSALDDQTRSNPLLG